MASYLYVLSIGPVQGFIAAARRTRDVWIGSHLLSEISKAAAKKIRDKKGELIFPGLEDKFLEPSESPEAPNVANVVLAELPDGADPIELNEEIQAAAKNEWLRYANGARFLAEKKAPGFVNEDVWKYQVKDVIEFYSAWVPMPADKAEYRFARMRLMQILAGRKATRNFIQPMRDDRLPKSSLDGERDTVLQKKNRTLSKELTLKMRLKAGEELCAVGLTKRLGGRRFEDSENSEDAEIELEAFPSVVRIALDPWIRGIIKSGDEAEKILNDVKVICKGKNFAQGAGRWQNKERYPEFPFDGQVLHLPRIAVMLKAIVNSKDPQKKTPDRWTGWEAQLTDKDKDALTRIERLVKRLQKSGKTEDGEKCFGFGEPERYYAILVADGDRMGKVISRLDRNEHISFSKDLSKFANDARAIVRKHNGCMVYSGGDDVLAFLPLDCCLQAARDLHDCFGTLLEKYKIIDPDDKDQKEKTPTISVGIAIGHSMEPLEDMLKFGKEAEKDAKRSKITRYERDGLAVHIYPRSGAPIKIREQWKLKTEQINDVHVLNWAEMGLDERLLKWAEMHCTDVLPDSAAYGMHELAEDYRNWNNSSKEMEKELPNLIAADIMRLLKRKRGGAGTVSLTKENIVAMLNAGNPSEVAARLADEMILARRLADAMMQANGKKCEMAESKTQEVKS